MASGLPSFVASAVMAGVIGASGVGSKSLGPGAESAPSSSSLSVVPTRKAASVEAKSGCMRRVSSRLACCCRGVTAVSCGAGAKALAGGLGAVGSLESRLFTATSDAVCNPTPPFRAGPSCCDTFWARLIAWVRPPRWWLAFWIWASFWAPALTTAP
jgi:hypothetical protein